jgi:uncharacterized protein
MKYVAFGILGIMMVTASVFGYQYFFQEKKYQTIDILTPNGLTINAKVADTPEKRTLGLSGSDPLGNNEGMLFIFPTAGRYGFWMKNMLFAIDIIWIDQDGIIVHIENNVPPESFPQSFISPVDAVYVLEISAGMSSRFGLTVGERVSINE